MNKLSPHSPTRFVSGPQASAANTSRRLRLLTITFCLAVALFSAKSISGLDQNGDGMSDIWQQHYSVPSTDADLDYNGTGLTNRQKSLLGLDPRDSNARFHLDIVNDTPNNLLRLQLQTVHGKLYQIESSSDLRAWVALNSPITGTGQTLEITLPLPQPPIFFRASYAGDIDADGDGLTAWEESLLGTADNNADSDNDGMPDAWEYSHGLNPILNDANSDLDGDGATNLQEYQAGTDPYNSDTDGDGVADGIDGWPNEGSLSPPRLPAFRYAVIDLGINHWAYGINNAGQILGREVALDLGFIWQNGRETFVASPWVARINAAGEFFDTDYYYHRADGELVRVLVEGFGPSIWDFNDNGVMVGALIDPDGVAYPCMGVAGDFHLLPYDDVNWTPPPYVWQAIANDGWLGGYTQRRDSNNSMLPRKAVVSRDGTNAIELGTLTGFDSESFVDAIMVRNGAAYAVGYSINRPASTYRGFLWHDAPGDPEVHRTAMLDLGALAGARGSEAFRINQRLEIVGVNAFGVAPANVIKGVATLWRNGRPFDLNTLIDDPKWSLEYAIGINDKGLICGRGTISGALHSFLLVPVGLMVDGNGDGQMSFDDPTIHDADQTTKDKLYPFWLNDDDDTELNHNGNGGEPTDPTEEEKVPAPRPDHSLHQIASKRNLEDFARFWIYFGGLQDAISSGNIQVGLRWKNVVPGTSPAINIYPSADGDGSDSYLKDDAAAQAQISGVFNPAVTDKFDRQTVDTSGVFMFKSDYWNGLAPDNPKKCLLFEGAGEGKGELEIVFFDQSGTEIGKGGSVWLDLKNVKKMYQRAVATPDPLTPLPYQTSSSIFDESDINYSPDVSPRFEQLPDETPQCLVFVHGWRMSYDDSVSFSETMFKRLWWQGYKGRFAAFRWATQTSADSYNTSEWLAWKYGKSLANYVENYVKHQLPSYTINIAAHSMGNIVTASALKRGMTIDTYMLMEAAIPSGCYVDEVNNYPPFLTAEQNRHATPDTEIDNGYRLFLGSLATSVGKFVSFFNVNDFALATGATPFLGWPFETNWEQNQIDFKPNQFSNATFDYYDFFPNAPAGSRSVFFFNGTEVRSVTDQHETMSFVARPRSRAVGSEGNSAVVFTTSIDLQTEYGFTRDQGDHSGQFNRRIQQLDGFYRRVLQEVKQ